MTQDLRTNSAHSKRNEQINRWKESETCKESSQPKTVDRKVAFSNGCIFLASCAAGDREEVEDLLGRGADINTANVDGLTALHQACIDNNFDMVKLLVTAGADINKDDNEGWTPLHATASLGFLSIATFLLDHGADITAVNNDGELVIDISESDDMESLLRKKLDAKKVNCEEMRHREEQAMLNDAKDWYNSGNFGDHPHPRTGATALHVAAAKGYKEVINLLVKCGAGINQVDYDGWTPLHAAAHWAQREACEVLATHHADMEIKNWAGQTPVDVADPDVVDLLDELKMKQVTLEETNQDHKKVDKVTGAPGKNRKGKRSSIPRLSQQDKEAIKQLIKEEKAPKLTDGDGIKSEESQILAEDISLPTTVPVIHPISSNTNTHADIKDHPSIKKYIGTSKVATDKSKCQEHSKQNLGLNTNLPMRRPASLRSRPAKEAVTEDSNTDVRRARSFDSDEQFYSKLAELRQRIRANSVPTLSKIMPNCLPLNPLDPNTDFQSLTLPKNHKNCNKELGTSSLPRQLNSRLLSSTLDDHHKQSPTHSYTSQVDPKPSPVSLLNCNTKVATQDAFMPNPSSGVIASHINQEDKSKVGDHEVISQSPVNSPRGRSLVPPVRDETPEIQRKAHAKRVRETRRSTQGITLEDLKSAEQLAKKKQQQQAVQRSSKDQLGSSVTSVTASPSTGVLPPAITSTIMTTGSREDCHNSNSDMDIEGKEYFKMLWEKSQAENASLMRDMKLIKTDLESTKTQLHAAKNNPASDIQVHELGSSSSVTSVSSTAAPSTGVFPPALTSTIMRTGSREERMRLIDQLKIDNLRLREENGALIRVIAKLSK